MTDAGPARKTAGRPSVTAIVLAGGRAERFGSDKARAALDGVTLLDRAVDAALRVADDVIVAGRADARTRPDVSVVTDQTPFGGPLAGLAGALEQTQAELAIVVGADMPLLVPAVLAAMLEPLRADPSVEAVVLEAPGEPRRQVLPLAVHVSPAASAASAALGAGDRSLVGLVDRLTTHELPASAWRALDPAGLTLSDVDTPADLERLRASRP